MTKIRLNARPIITIHYRVDISRSGGKGSIKGDMMKITRLDKDSQSDQYKSLEGKEPFGGVFMGKNLIENKSLGIRLDLHCGFMG